MQMIQVKDLVFKPLGDPFWREQLVYSQMSMVSKSTPTRRITHLAAQESGGLLFALEVIKTSPVSPEKRLIVEVDFRSDSSDWKISKELTNELQGIES